ncbi:transposase [Streptococcus pneumoniae]|uniref:IS66 family insertion sequence element accessory protein TnpB n=1 Tax=Streptococcus pneumoniae TaxID=1313 RepID=UPI0008DCA507|nr:IS66 family insertion sequence element accessory protein TnpB [Streptococcus pneumoniae]OIB46798.1 transposase [Streptococcus pneumoniae]OIB50777.1 transposase [Streptococcus pneumoniae]
MTIHLSSLGQVYLVCGKTDMRQGIDSLAYLVKTHFELDPFSGQVFLFCGGRKDRFKALYWDGQGLAYEGLFYHSQNKFIRKS